MVMKRLLLLSVFCAAMFAACEKNDASVKDELKIAVVPHEGDFKHLTLDSVYVLRNAGQFADLIGEKDDIAIPNVDFSSSVLLAVNGIAPAEVMSIIPKLYEQNGDYTLSLSVSVDKGRGVMPRKWSLLLSAPSSVGSSIGLDAKFDMVFDDMALPSDRQRYNEYYPFMPLRPIEGAYMVVMRDEDAAMRLVSVVNADEDCILIRPRTFAGGAYGDKAAAAIYETYSNGTYSNSGSGYPVRVLKNCDYDKIVAPMLETEILYAGNAVIDDYDFGLGTAVGFEIPVAAIGAGEVNDSDALDCLLGSLGHVAGEGNVKNVYIYRNSALSQTQLYYLLAADGYLSDTRSVSARFHLVPKVQFDDSAKEYYD